MLPYGRQSIDEEDIAAVASVLRSDFLTAGPKVEEFERRFAEMAGAKHAVAVNSATSALHLAMRVANIGPGDRVITSPNTFLASANSAAFVGAIPDFADIDPISFNLDPASLEAAWLPDTKAVVAVDYAGQSCDMPAIAQVARAHGAIIIEDAAHATGGRFEHAGKQWKVGAHPWADMSVFSFHPVKTMTTGEGGMLVTDNGQWALKARQLRSHGVIREGFAGLGAEDDPELAERGPWYYEMESLGYNYRITDIQCALGISQIARLNQFTARRREIVARYNEALAGIPWLATPGLRNTADLNFTSWHLYTIQIDFRAIGKTRTQVMSELRKQGIGSQVLYIPVHLQPWYRRSFGYAPGKCPVAERFYTRCLSLPLYPGLKESDLDQVTDGVRNLSRSHAG